MRYCFYILLLTAQLSAEPVSNTHLEHSVSNLETESSYLKQKIENQEVTIESLREEVSALVKATKELSTKSAALQDVKLNKVEKSLEKFVSDMKQLKAHINTNAELLAELQKTVRAQGEANRLQEKQIESVEAAIKSLAKAMQGSFSPSSSKDSSGKTYRVKSGDSLAKIAKECNTTTSELKQLNTLRSDKITPGQELKIP